MGDLAANGRMLYVLRRVFTKTGCGNVDWTQLAEDIPVAVSSGHSNELCDSMKRAEFRGQLSDYWRSKDSAVSALF